MRTHASNLVLAGVVWLHLVVTLVHGWAHASAGVELGPAAMAFVILVILVGPVAALAFTRVNPMVATLAVGATMAAALLFGLVNHFLVHGIDHVSHVDARWRLLFGSTAALLVLTETAGVAAAGWRIVRVFRRVS
jgi:hypothetical protein